ncbi:hypothetical protein QUB37_16570 [Microcoleus sp. AT3-A2]|uniref:hypothetical protein n=1 Tax=Microcoleus sp. AT3-A2 TaxID=2818610 RepID=UPI002FD73AD8
MLVRETSIHKDSGFSTDFFHTLIKQCQIWELSNSRGEIFQQQLGRFSHLKRSHLRVIGLSAIASNNPQNFNYYRIVDRSDRDRLK